MKSTDTGQLLMITMRINEMTASVLDPVNAAMRDQDAPLQHQAIVWQALAREAMLRSQAASAQVRDARRTRREQDAGHA